MKERNQKGVKSIFYAPIFRVPRVPKPDPNKKKKKKKENAKKWCIGQGKRIGRIREEERGGRGQGDEEKDEDEDEIEAKDKTII